MNHWQYILRLWLFSLLSFAPALASKMLESGVNYDFDATGKPAFSDFDAHNEPISWARCHVALDQAVAARQYELLVTGWHTRGPAFVVIDYTVSNTGHIAARSLSPEEPEFQAKFADAQSEYHLNERTSRLFLKPNLQFAQLTLKAYQSMENDPLLKFPEGSSRKMVHDVRWHIDAAGIKRSVRSQLDDVEGH